MNIEKLFMEQVREELNKETQCTENGAKGYRTSGKALLDLNFRIPSYRKADENSILNDFIKAYNENPTYAIAYMFFARDAREGLGERNFFRICFKWLAFAHTPIAEELLPLIAEYGRWDDMLCAYDTELQDAVIDIYRKQLAKDMANYSQAQPISLLAKWLPSINTSSKKTVNLAKSLFRKLGFTNEKYYRRTLSILRKYLDVTEVKISANNWDRIDYEKVPSKANLLYNNAFLKHDTERRRDFLGALERGEAKINASVLYPYDIVHKYFSTQGWFNTVRPYDITLEELWKALPNLVQENSNTIVVADGSGSMTAPIGNTSVSALSVANSIAIYFSEKSKGQFANKYITFSERPQFVDFSRCKSLRGKIELALKFDECANTNIEAVFNLILNTAINNKLSQKDIPANILIISDMEFDCGASHTNNTLLKEISNKYKVAGYELPRLVFWNVNSRTNTIPLQQNKLGVTLVSGFSINICKMILSGKLDPYDCLVEQLTSDRYAPIINIAKKYE